MRWDATGAPVLRKPTSAACGLRSRVQFTLNDLTGSGQLIASGSSYVEEVAMGAPEAASEWPLRREPDRPVADIIPVWPFMGREMPYRTVFS